MDTLVHLAARAGEVVSGDELIDAVWQGRVVYDAQIYKIISELRRAFRDHGNGEPFIQTVPKRGYRLVAPVAPAQPRESSAGTGHGAISSRTMLGYAATAVLVLAVLLLAGGFPGENRRLPGVVAPETPDGQAAFGGESQTAPSTGSLAVVPFDVLGSSDEDAYFAAGFHDEILNQAIALDPAFAEAHARKADVYVVSMVDSFAAGTANRYDLEEIDRRARMSAETALALDPGLASAYMALGRLHQYRWRWTEAGQAFERAFVLNPDDLDVMRTYAQFSSHAGDHVKAVSLAMRATALAPTQSGLLFREGSAHLYAAEYDSAVAAFHRSIEMNPGHALARGDKETALDALHLAAAATSSRIPDVSYHNLMLAQANVFADPALEGQAFQHLRDRIELVLKEAVASERGGGGAKMRPEISAHP